MPTQRNPNTAAAPGELPAAQPLQLADQLDYVPGSIVSRTIAKASGCSLSLFAFDQGQALHEHTAPFDALVQVLDGAVELTISGHLVRARRGETVLLPAHVPHALRAVERFKMLLSMVRN